MLDVLTAYASEIEDYNKYFGGYREDVLLGLFLIIIIFMSKLSFNLYIYRPIFIITRSINSTMGSIRTI